jgi:DNA-directed RNA polymerase specialized sigma24 family protein
MDDSKIVELFFDRSELAISETSKKYGRYCHYIAYNILRNNKDAEECVNDTYLRAWNSIPPKRPNKLQTYLGKITRNLALNMLEKLTAQKRGKGQIPLVLDELGECIPDDPLPISSRICISRNCSIAFLTRFRQKHGKYSSVAIGT